MTVTHGQRQTIRRLARNCCEYCRVREDDLYSRFQIDHIIPIKHGGRDEIDNLCLACLKCNSFKGPNVAALDPLTGDATRLFNPRQQVWYEHFRIEPDATLTGISPEGRATIIVLRMNDERRILHRHDSMASGVYPCQPA